MQEETCLDYPISYSIPSTDIMIYFGKEFKIGKPFRKGRNNQLWTLLLDKNFQLINLCSLSLLKPHYLFPENRILFGLYKIRLLAGQLSF